MLNQAFIGYFSLNFMLNRVFLSNTNPTNLTNKGVNLNQS